MKIFIDTSAFVALLVESETAHKMVAKKYLDYRQRRASFITSDYVLDELFTRLQYYKLDLRKYIEKLKSSIAKNEIVVLRIEEGLFDKALGVFLKFSDHKISFTDATSFVLYKDFALDEIFTLDSDFKKIRLTTSF